MQIVSTVIDRAGSRFTTIGYYCALRVGAYTPVCSKLSSGGATRHDTDCLSLKSVDRRCLVGQLFACGA